MCMIKCVLHSLGESVVSNVYYQAIRIQVSLTQLQPNLSLHCTRQLHAITPSKTPYHKPLTIQFSKCYTAHSPLTCVILTHSSTYLSISSLPWYMATTAIAFTSPSGSLVPVSASSSSPSSLLARNILRLWLVQQPCFGEEVCCLVAS